MPRKIQIGFAVLLLAAAVVTLAFAVRIYRRDRNAFPLLYTRSVKAHDIVDAARNALAALDDAEIREQNYVLTGETVYSEAYTDDIRKWQDEFAVLDLVARKDAAAPLVEDLSKAGTRTLAELALVVSLYDKRGRDTALDRIRKGAGIVYLDQARSSVAKIQDVDGAALETNRTLADRAALSLRHLVDGAAVLFFVAATGTLLLILEITANAKNTRALKLQADQQ